MAWSPRWSWRSRRRLLLPATRLPVRLALRAIPERATQSRALRGNPPRSVSRSGRRSPARRASARSGMPTAPRWPRVASAMPGISVAMRRALDTDGTGRARAVHTHFSDIASDCPVPSTDTVPMRVGARMRSVVHRHRVWRRPSRARTACIVKSRLRKRAIRPWSGRCATDDVGSSGVHGSLMRALDRPHRSRAAIAVVGDASAKRPPAPDGPACNRIGEARQRGLCDGSRIGSRAGPSRPGARGTAQHVLSLLEHTAVSCQGAAGRMFSTH